MRQSRETQAYLLSERKEQYIIFITMIATFCLGVYLGRYSMYSQAKAGGAISKEYISKIKSTMEVWPNQKPVTSPAFRFTIKERKSERNKRDTK